MSNMKADALNLQDYAYIVIFTTMTFLSTSLFYISIVTTNGYFNIGDTFVYLAALIGGPVVGGIAGGLGPALADIALGYGYFAPGTLVFKGAEGFVAGYLFYNTKNLHSKLITTFKFLVLFFGIGFLSFYGLLGLNNLLGNPIVQYPTMPSFGIPIHLVIIVLITVLAGGIALWVIITRLEQEEADMMISCILSGSFIVVGYFLYEVLLLGIPVEGALFEIYVNIGQVVVGTVIVVPVIFYLRDLGIIPESVKLIHR